MGGSAKAASARRNAFEETSSVFAEASLFCACFLGEGRYLFFALLPVSRQVLLDA